MDDFLEHVKTDHTAQKAPENKRVRAAAPAEPARLRQQFYNDLYLRMVGKEFKTKPAVLNELNRHHTREEEKDMFGHLKLFFMPQVTAGLFEVTSQTGKEVKPQAETTALPWRSDKNGTLNHN